jgi:SEC-C motif
VRFVPRLLSVNDEGDFVTTTSLPILTRSCGECEECCRVVAVAELNKPYHTPCVHQTGKGCGIYGDHPAECREYACVWLQGKMPEEMRPDKIGILVDAEGGDEWVVVQECRPGALAAPVGRAVISQISGVAEHLRGGVRIEPHGAHKQAVSTDRGMPGVYKQIAPKIYLYVGVDDRATVATTGDQSKHTVGTRRNDLCPCGSNKKYKRCCMRG